MKKHGQIRIGISIGDLNGIGSEIIIKTFEDSRMLDFCTPVIFASNQVMKNSKKMLGSEIQFHGIQNCDQILENKINLFSVWKENVEIEFGKEDQKIGSYSVKSLQAAVTSLKNDEIQALVTAPINKSNVQSKEFFFPGHTDYLAKELNGKSLMLMVADKLRVGLLTDHVPVKDVSSKLTKQLIRDKVETIVRTLKQDFCIEKPVVAVLSLNPHAGDHGVIGNEDDEILRPCLEELREEGTLVFGPYSADSFFGSGNYKEFDAIIATYHDQGLIPFKTLSFGKGVNFTAGLSKVRTSPDHGTAYEIAGKGIADESSFKEAVFKAIEIFRNRKQHLKYSKNPLKSVSKKG